LYGRRKVHLLWWRDGVDIPFEVSAKGMDGKKDTRKKTLSDPSAQSLMMVAVMRGIRFMR
jgi:hypothetical protein